MPYPKREEEEEGNNEDALYDAKQERRQYKVQH